MPMIVNVYSLKKILFQDEAISLNAKSIDGELTILQNHIPLITELESGDLKIVDKDEKMHIIAISSGFLEVNPREVKVLCETYAKSN